jgi:hypothetical protein
VEGENTQTARNEPDLLPPRVIEGRDELNLAEFPLSAIADRLQPEQKTLVFEDRIFDESRGDMVTRQLTITASDQYGLPTALDDEVILGLVQISKMQDFQARKVSFTRYQLIQLLGWRDDSKSYERLEKSLNRWVGVTLYYKNAWWSKEDKCWVDEKFHILDNVTLFDREKARRAPPGKQAQLPLSTFTWNDVIFRSFKAGNLKSIDFDFLKNLESAISKRLYRFLDKRFYHRKRWEFNLKEVSWEHIGLSRNYDVGSLKRELLPAIRELEASGFLKAMSDQERFLKLRSGQWNVVFERARAAEMAIPKDSDSGREVLVKALIERGVSATTAEQTASSFSAETIRNQIEVFDWLVSKNDAKISKNPAGFLVSSIKGEYAPPRGFLDRNDEENRKAQAEARKRQNEERARKRAEREKAQREAREGAIQDFWQSLSEDERRRLEEEAFAQATQFQKDALTGEGPVSEAVRKSLLDSYALLLMKEAA